MEKQTARLLFSFLFIEIFHKNRTNIHKQNCVSYDKKEFPEQLYKQNSGIPTLSFRYTYFIMFMICKNCVEFFHGESILSTK